MKRKETYDDHAVAPTLDIAAIARASKTRQIQTGALLTFIGTLINDASSKLDVQASLIMRRGEVVLHIQGLGSFEFARATVRRSPGCLKIVCGARALSYYFDVDAPGKGALAFKHGSSAVYSGRLRS